jgi:glutathione S-transferase
MSFTITVPPNYGYVILSSVIGSGFVVSTYMGGAVMQARKKFQVPYPNLYATPGYHKDADAFNRVQRGHQSYFELLPTFMILALIGGLKHPIASSVLSLVWSLGCVLFLVGYSDTNLDVAMARYKKGGGLKWIGFLGVIGLTISLCGDMNGWW